MGSGVIAALAIGSLLGGAVGVGAGRWIESTGRAWATAKATRRAVRPRYREAWSQTVSGLGRAAALAALVIVAVIALVSAGRR